MQASYVGARLGSPSRLGNPVASCEFFLQSSQPSSLHACKAAFKGNFANMRKALLRSAAVASGRTAALRGAAPVLQQRRAYQGNLQDKDRIYTNLYNDQSPYLEAAKKRVRARPWEAATAARLAPATARRRRASRRARPTPPRRLCRGRATGTRQRSSC